MYFLALAADYDGTLAHGGVVDDATEQALYRFKETGRRLILVTGRELEDLKHVYRRLDVFDLVVAENGALLYDPADDSERLLAEPPPQIFIQRLEERRVEPLSVGRVIVATWEPAERAVLDAIRDLGLELQIIFNKGAVMVLPPSVNKATGLAVALEQLGLSPHNVVAVGDAENDHAFMSACGYSAAVANALPLLKAHADTVLEGTQGAGVVELIERIVADDRGLVTPRHSIEAGEDHEGVAVALEPHRGSVLIAGTSGVGKSTLATALTERMAERRFEFCVFDPEGDYHDLEHAVAVGDVGTAPQIGETLELLEQLGTNVVVNTQYFDMAERPLFFAKLLPQVASLRARTGRPHWLLIDEAHHLLPAKRSGVDLMLPESLPGVVLITVHPEALAREALENVHVVLAVGDNAAAVIGTVCDARGLPHPQDVPRPGRDEAVIFELGSGKPPRLIKPAATRQARRRHTRKYAEGKLGKDRSFYFRGPDSRLNLRAHNLMLFVELSEGVDDETWEYHRRCGDYSTWVRDAIKDESLADEIAAIESDPSLDAKSSRKRIASAVHTRYTVPADPA